MQREDFELDAEAVALVREGPREFHRVREDCYRLLIPDFGITIEADRLRRQRGKLVGELKVECSLPGAKGYQGVVSLADMNLSEASARSSRSKLVRTRVRDEAAKPDWDGILEEFCQRVLLAEREGEPLVRLADVKPTGTGDLFDVEGVLIPWSHPMIIFGDGESCKSLLTLWLAGKIAERGAKVALFDWEMDEQEHLQRLGGLFGADTMPVNVHYTRCKKALIYEVDRLRREVRDKCIDYAIFDSAGFASDGAPEDAEVAMRYFRAVRELGIGSIHIAHVRGGENADKRPFGSVFWSNAARVTWYCKAIRRGNLRDVGLFNRKNNLGSRVDGSVGFQITFTPQRILVESTSVADTELAQFLPVEERMQNALNGVPMSVELLAQAINASAKEVKAVANSKSMFYFADGKVGLAQ